MISIDKKYRTKNGDVVVLLGTNGREPYPVYGYIGESIVVEVWTKEGVFSDRSDFADYDLVEEEDGGFPDLSVGTLVYIESSYIYVLAAVGPMQYTLINLETGQFWEPPGNLKDIWGDTITPQDVFKLPPVTQKVIKDQLAAIGDTVQAAMFSSQRNSL